MGNYKMGIFCNIAIWPHQKVHLVADLAGILEAGTSQEGTHLCGIFFFYISSIEKIMQANDWSVVNGLVGKGLRVQNCNLFK